MSVRVSRRHFLLQAAGMATGAVLAACAAPQATPLPGEGEALAPATTPSAPAKGRVVVAVNGVNQPTWLNAQAKLAATYNEFHPEIEVVWEGATGPGFNYPQWLGTMLAADPVYVDLVAGNYQASYRNYLDLNPYRQAINPYTKRKWEEDYDFEAFNATDATGKYYFTCGYVVHCYWFYNKEMFDEAGATPPQTWPEWIETCERLKRSGVTPIAANYTYMVPQWDAEVYYDQFMRIERYEFGRALEGDWNYDPDIDGRLTFDPKDKHFDRSYTFNTQRWLKNLKDGNFSYNRREIALLVQRMGEIFNTNYCTQDLFVMTDVYLPFLQRQVAIMNNGTWSIPTLLRDMTELTDARREQLQLGQDVKIEPFEWGTFENPSMIDPETDGPARAVESAAGPYCSVVQKDQAQTERSLDFQMFWYSPVGWQVWVDALIADNAFTPSGPPFVKGVRLPEEYRKMFEGVQMLGNAEIPWNQCVRLGAQGSQLYQGTEQLFTDALQGKIEPTKYAESLQELVLARWEDILAGSNLSETDIDHPERKPVGA